ncbi:MAG: uridine diphosphate-N-acetylglucosamine-binding protein YvcK [Aggregatilineales bacterium]
MVKLHVIFKWFTLGIGIKRWLILATLGVGLVALGIALILLETFRTTLNTSEVNWLNIVLSICVGSAIVSISLVKLTNNLLAPYRRHQSGHVIDVVYAHSKRQKGLRVVALGGGTGLPSVLRGIKPFTSNITAVVTVADDGGSSGRLRRELGVLPPGDLRNNIAALADDESLMTQLFQYRFENGDLGGHSFGNLFIAALAGVSGGLETALTEVERVLNIQGRVLPATLEDINLVASIKVPGKSNPLKIQGESKISEVGGQIEQLSIIPEDAEAFPGSVDAILDADIIVIGPGSLYTSIIPNMLVKGIADALRATSAYKIYICNVATQPGETTAFTVADHVLALEKHIGRGVFQAVLANNAYPSENAGQNTFYVTPVPENHEILQRYEVRYTDLTDEERPWRHDPKKLAQAILRLNNAEKSGSIIADPIFVNG